MKIQVAIDRVDLARATVLASQLDGLVDRIELGTSLIKDYGLFALADIKAQLNHATLVMDIKTIDEGVYECKQGYAAQADVLTVMGTADLATIQAVYDVAQEADKEIFIDLLNTSKEQIKQLLPFTNATFGLHHSHDNARQFEAADAVKAFHQEFPTIRHIAVAGGVTLEQVKKLTADGIAEVAIVGGKIVGQPNPVAAAKAFQEVTKK